ncbi:hypothetical protein [Methanogenium cariaci]|uniref:hypothetical protein n=1 Tax=Methanogenium cariaci TaxID=2197 RepID=UPI000782F420|nr:hypothetical protein [Methanogenium cariaci]
MRYREINECRNTIPSSCEFYRNVTINDNPALAGTVIMSFIGEEKCGILTITEAGRFGLMNNVIWEAAHLSRE